MGLKAAYISDGFAGWLETGGPVERSAPDHSPQITGAYVAINREMWGRVGVQLERLTG